MNTTTTARKATIELDADLVAKIRASVRAVSKNQTLEEFVEMILFDMLEPHTGIFEGLIEHEQRREKIEGKLDRIRKNDRRLVHSEPLARNAVIYTAEMVRLRTLAAAAGYSVNGTLNSLLDGALTQCESGTRGLVPTTGKGGAA